MTDSCSHDCSAGTTTIRSRVAVIVLCVISAVLIGRLMIRIGQKGHRNVSNDIKLYLTGLKGEP